MHLPSFKHKPMRILISLLSVCLLFRGGSSVWNLHNDQIQREMNLQRLHDTSVVHSSFSADLNMDGKEECLVLMNEILQINDCEQQVAWQSPEGWQVKEALISDLNLDHEPEVALVVWRPFQPWPVDRFLPAGGRIQYFHDQSGLSCHLILIGWTRHGYNELWAGSALIRPVSQIQAVDLDQDDRQELVALEGDYDSAFSGGALTVWRWQGFGFTLVNKVEKKFNNLTVVGNSVQNWVIAQ